jgi:hypothetical protein
MQHHMSSCNTIKCTVSICENIKIRYIIGLLFIVTEAQISLLLETSVGLAVRIFPATTRTFTKDTALSENGRGAAWHVWINAARHGRRTAWAQHGMCELAFIVFQAYWKCITRRIPRSTWALCAGNAALRGTCMEHIWALVGYKRRSWNGTRAIRDVTSAICNVTSADVEVGPPRVTKLPAQDNGAMHLRQVKLYAIAVSFGELHESVRQSFLHFWYVLCAWWKIQNWQKVPVFWIRT